VSSPARAIAHTGTRRGRHDQRQRPRPEALAEHQRGVVEDTFASRRRETGDMRDQRVEAGPAFGGVNSRDRLAARRVGAEPIDGLGREGDELSRCEQLRRAGDAG
jgi:hypothetical protein